MTEPTFESDTHALAEMLVLSITAPSEEQSKRALDLAEHFARSAGMTAFDVKRAKKMAVDRIAMIEASNE